MTNAGNIALNGSINISGLLDNSGTITPGAGSTVTLNNTGDNAFEGGSSFANLVLDGTGNLTTSGALDVNETLTINGPSLVVSDASHGINVGEDLTLITGGFTPGDGTVTLDGNGGQTISGGFTFNNLVLSGGGAKVIADNTIVNTEITVEAGTTLDLNTNDPELSLAGDLTLNDAFVDAGASKVIFNGSSRQRVSGTGSTNDVTLNDVEFSNTAATGSDDIQLSLTLSVNGQVDFVSGVVQSTASNSFVFNDNATITYDRVNTDDGTAGGGLPSQPDGSSYVNGPVTKIGDDAFNFPTGDGSIFARFGISAPASATDQFTVQYFDTGAPDNLNVGASGMDNVSGIEYWDLSRDLGSSEPIITLYWEDNTRSDFTELADLVVAHYEGAPLEWVNKGNVQAAGGAAAASGFITSTSSFSFNGPTTFGTTNSVSNPLPVELMYFEGVADEGDVDLSWATAVEIGNERFEILHSLDGQEFDMVGSVAGAGDSDEVNEYSFVHREAAPGLNYYRLRQVDFDGSSVLSRTIQVENNQFNVNFEAVIYPNPGRAESLSIKLTSVDRHTPVEVSIVDLSGKVHFRRNLLGVPVGDQQLGVDKPIAAGLYFVDIKQGSTLIREKLVIK